jgi:hypothetical protein
MASYGFKSLNWAPKVSAWQSMQTWRSQRSQMAQQFQNDAAALSNGFLNAQDAQVTGMATLAAQASINRAQDQIKAAQAATGAMFDLLA